MYIYINTCEQGYQSNSFIGKYKECLFTPNNICFAEIPIMNKQKPIRTDYIGFCLIGGSCYHFMVAKS